MSDDAALLDQVFAGLPSVMFCRKDTTGRYVAANDAFVRRAGRKRVAEVLDRTAADLFPPTLAASYDAQDRAVLATGRSVRGQLEVIADDVQSGWFLTNKVLARDPQGRAAGIVVVSVPALLGRGTGDASGLRAVVELVRERFAEPLHVDEMAAAASLSVERLERAMRRTLEVAPKQFLVRVRVEQAGVLLATTTLPIADIAARCGFYDQSQLTRQFRAHVGVTPGAYRSGRDEPRI